MVIYQGTCERCSTPFRVSRAPYQSVPRFCSNHCRLTRNGETPAEVLDHFLDKSGGPDACWVFTGHKRRGYGYVFHDYRYYRAHRLAWELATGETLTDTDLIGHVCDNPACARNDDVGVYVVNGIELPRIGHLFKGTNTDNDADRDAKGRGIKGDTHPNSRLREEDIPELRALRGKVTLAVAAAQYGVTLSAVWYVWHGKTWRHVP